MKSLIHGHFSDLIITLSAIAVITLSPIILNAQNPDWIVYDPENSPLPDTDIESLAIDMNGNIWIGTFRAGLARFNRKNWTIYNESDYKAPSRWVSAIQHEGQRNIWIGTSPAGSVEGCLAMFDGRNWTVYRNSLTRHIQSLAIDAQGNKWFGAQNIGLVCFDGENWIIYNTNNSDIPRNDASTIAIDSQGNKWIGQGYQGYGVVRFDSTNWTIYNTANSGLPHNEIANIFIDNFGNKWIGTLGGGLAKFDNENWTVYNTFNSELPSDYVWTMTMDDQDTLWVGMGNYGGLAKFDGANWTIFNTSNSGLPYDVVSELAFDDYGNLWIGTYFGGVAVYREGGVMMTGIEDMCQPSLPSGFSLYQNFPNPFNWMTTILYELPVPQYVILKVYDIQGHEVETLVDQTQNEGIYHFRFDATHLPSGTYFYRLMAGQFSEIKKLTIVK